MVARSSTITTTTSPSTSMRTSLNRPVANSARSAAARLLVGVAVADAERQHREHAAGVGALQAFDADVARSGRGSIASAARGQRGPQRITQAATGASGSGRVKTSGSLLQAQEAGHVVGKGERHQQQDGKPRHAAAGLPQLGDRTTGHTLEKIIHQVSPVEDRQRQQVQHAETHADQRRETPRKGEAELRRLGGWSAIVAARSGSSATPRRSPSCRACAGQRRSQVCVTAPVERGRAQPCARRPARQAADVTPTRANRWPSAVVDDAASRSAQRLPSRRRPTASHVARRRRGAGRRDRRTAGREDHLVQVLRVDDGWPSICRPGRRLQARVARRRPATTSPITRLARAACRGRCAPRVPCVVRIDRVERRRQRAACPTSPRVRDAQLQRLAIDARASADARRSRSLNERTSCQSPSRRPHPSTVAITRSPRAGRPAPAGCRRRRADAPAPARRRRSIATNAEARASSRLAAGPRPRRRALPQRPPVEGALQLGRIDRRLRARRASSRSRRAAARRSRTRCSGRRLRAATARGPKPTEKRSTLTPQATRDAVVAVLVDDDQDAERDEEGRRLCSIASRRALPVAANVRARRVARARRRARAGPRSSAASLGRAAARAPACRR